MKLSVRLLAVGTGLQLVTACSKPEQITLNLKTNSERVTSANSADSVRTDCKSTTGQDLEFCEQGIPVECSKKTRGVYCTQYTSGSNGRMWGPF